MYMRIGLLRASAVRLLTWYQLPFMQPRYQPGAGGSKVICCASPSFALWCLLIFLLFCSSYFLLRASTLWTRCFLL